MIHVTFIPNAVKRETSWLLIICPWNCDLLGLLFNTTSHDLHVLMLIILGIKFPLCCGYFSWYLNNMEQFHYLRMILHRRQFVANRTSGVDVGWSIVIQLRWLYRVPWWDDFEWWIDKYKEGSGRGPSKGRSQDLREEKQRIASIGETRTLTHTRTHARAHTRVQWHNS